MKKDIHGDMVQIGDTIRYFMGMQTKGTRKVPIWKEVVVKKKTYIPVAFEIVETTKKAE